MSRRLLAAIAPLLLAALAGCTPPTPGMVPMLALPARDCSAPPALAAGKPLDLSEHTTATTDLDTASPCLLTPDGTPALYAVFRLPPLAPAPQAGTVLRIDSMPLGRALLAPRLTLLNAQAQPTRSFDASAFRYRGTAFSALVALHQGEAFALVSSDPSAVGRKQDRLHSTMTATTLVAGPAVFTVFTGADSESHTMLSLNGRVVATLSRAAAQ